MDRLVHLRLSPAQVLGALLPPAFQLAHFRALQGTLLKPQPFFHKMHEAY